MKKFFSLLAVMALVVMASSSVWAAALAQKAARVTFTAAAIQFDVALYHWGGSGSYETGQATATQINFVPSDVTLGTVTPSTSTSSDYALITSNLSQQPANTHVYVYTDNVNNSSDFKAKSPSTTADGYNGLVRKGNGDTFVDGDYATVITKCVAVSSANANYNTTNGPRDAVFDYDGQSSGDRWLADKSTTGFNSQANVIGKGGVGGGIYIGAENSSYATNWYSTEQVVMFFRAIFHSVNGGDEYGTDTIKFNQVVE